MAARVDALNLRTSLTMVRRPMSCPIQKTVTVKAAAVMPAPSVDSWNLGSQTPKADSIPT